MDVVAVPVLSGGFGYLGSKMILGNSGSVNLGGMSLDKNIAVGGLVAAGALVAQSTKDFVIPKIPIADARIKKVAEMAVGPVICGVTTGVLNSSLVSESSFFGPVNQSGMVTNIAVGAGSYLAGQYTYDMLLKK